MADSKSSTSGPSNKGKTNTTSQASSKNNAANDKRVVIRLIDFFESKA